MRKVLTFTFLLVLAVSAAAQQSLRPGSAAPEFAGESLDGKMYNLSQLQGKVVVLTFWSTRCEICHNEIPKLNRVAERYRDKGVVFLAPTMDNQAKVGPYIKKNPFNFDILPNSFGVMLKYADMDKSGNINMGFPAYYLIDQRGAIALKSSGWDKISGLESQITKLLSE
jgi:peroxiredoxin